MPSFTFVVKDKKGKTLTGTVEAESRNVLLEQLWKQQLTVLSVNEAAGADGRGLSKFKMGPSKIRLNQLVIFSRQLATLIESGISVVPALAILSDQIEDKNFQKILIRMKEEVESGSNLSEAAAKFPQAFSDLYCNMIQAGESSGQLDVILDRVASYLEKTGALQRKVTSSLIYPAFVTLLAFGITAFLLIVIVPKFRDIFVTLGGGLPKPTQMLLDVSDLVKSYWVIGLILIIVGVVVGKMYIATPGGRLNFDKLILKTPVLGSLMRKVAIARFSQTLSTLSKSGVPILTALDIVAKTSGNRVIELAVSASRASIREGENISTPLTQSKVFPVMVTRMIAVGEKTGELEKMLAKIAEFYESEVDAAVTALTSLIEPLVIALLGIMIGGIAVCLLLPVFNLSSLV